MVCLDFFRNMVTGSPRRCPGPLDLLFLGYTCAHTKNTFSVFVCWIKSSVALASGSSGAGTNLKVGGTGAARKLGA